MRSIYNSSYYNHKKNIFYQEPFIRGYYNSHYISKSPSYGTIWNYYKSNKYIRDIENKEYDTIYDISILANDNDNYDEKKYIGGVLTNNGYIYCIPFNSDNVLLIDTKTNIGSKYDGLCNINDVSENNKWSGGVFAPNGLIYCIPFNSPNVLVIDTNTNTYDINIYYMKGYFGDRKWAGGILAPNGKIYCVPFDSENILVIDTKENIGYDEIIGLTGFGKMKGKWIGGILGPDGNIYCIPNKHKNILVIDTEHNKAKIYTDNDELKLKIN